MGQADAWIWATSGIGHELTTPVELSPTIRPAASVLLWRKVADGIQILMGQRGAAAAFMPSKFVFPGGAVDPGDKSEGSLSPQCSGHLRQLCPPGAPQPEAFAGCALRELVEETGLVLRPGAPLTFMFRAVTPVGMSRRFDARFFMAAASELIGDPDDFSAATEELSRLQWIGLDAAQSLDLPFITEIILAEASGLLAGHPQPGVPFFDNSGPVPTFRRLG